MSDNWLTIAYYELARRVGEPFHAKSDQTEIIVDGFTQPPNYANDRFCLGQLSNVNRNSTIENTRRHIGKGICLKRIDGKTYLKCLSKQAVFVQSQNYNAMYQNPLNTVCKLPTEHEMVIFDDTAFAQMLMSESGPKDYQSAVNFSKMCTIRVSFVKGWGNDYHRQDVTSTPCWIEIHLSSPMKWIDNILRQLESPDNQITSVS